VFEVDFSSLKEVEMSAETPDVTSQEALALAHVRRVKGFYIHLMQYGVTIAVLAVANILLYPRYFWVVPNRTMIHIIFETILLMALPRGEIVEP
jgi:hypothetical protein